MTARPFVPTNEQRRLVKAMASFAVPRDDIALVARCSPTTLRQVEVTGRDGGLKTVVYRLMPAAPAPASLPRPEDGGT